MRLIDADALRSVFDAMHAIKGSSQLDHYVLLGIKKYIDDAPTIDAVHVVHGRWVRAAGKSNIWYCSVCGDKINYKQNRRTYNIQKVPVEQKNKFCRNCGAKMDGGAEG